jgi:hypothetical protein
MGSPATGFLHVVRIGGDIDPVNAVYRIVFAPLDGSLRDRQAQREGLDALTDYSAPTVGELPLMGEASWIAKAAEPGADRVPDDFAPRVQALDAGPAYEYARRGLEP